LKRGVGIKLENAFKMEFRLTQNFMQGHDFFEGVRANLVDKDKTPQWQHENIFKVSEDEVLAYFEPVEGTEDLDVEQQLLS
jgi:enoyl-CoA hydratase